MIAATIHLEKQGQFFTEIDVDGDGVVVAVRPQLEWFWKNAKLVNVPALRPGDDICYHGIRTRAGGLAEPVIRKMLYRGAPLRAARIVRGVG